MLSTINHRGPDDEGIYTSPQIGFGHRRLSIIGLSTGHQPLTNEDGTIWITFNGEIYNYKELKRDLQARGHRFKTDTDTEVIVHLYEELGERCVEKLRGMFAFGIWDERNATLFLARDRVGIKPLYYCLTNRGLTFASEIKAILADPAVTPEVMPAMIDRFLRFLYVPGEETLFHGICKLAPGSCLTAKGGKIELRRYWDLEFVPSSLTFRDAVGQLEELLEESVQLHMISDVPVGFLLSGGVDSTAMLSLANGKTEHALSSFTVGFDSSVIDERPYAKLAARVYGTRHHEISISAKEFQDFLPKYAWHMEEPVCEPPAVALYYVSRLARESVKVLISGEGGDEAFGGYPNYRNILWLERFKALAGPLNGLVSAVLSSANKLVRSRKVAKAASLLNTSFESYYYGRTFSPDSWFNQHSTELYSNGFAETASKELSIGTVAKYLGNGRVVDRVNRMLYVDTKTWLPDDLLLKADKMTMANSVELRVPFLDHKLLEFAASLPGNYKVRGLQTKYVAKKTLSRRVPAEIIERKKVGFPVPYASWLRTDMRGWLHDVLLDRKTLSRGYFRRTAIEHLLAESDRSGAYSRELFSLAVLELWHRVFLEK